MPKTPPGRPQDAPRRPPGAENLGFQSVFLAAPLQTSILERLGFDFGSIFRCACAPGSNIGPMTLSKLKRPMCTTIYCLQYETMVFDLPRGSEIEDKSMPTRLQDKSGFHAAKNHEKVSNISPSWRSKSSQVASNSKWKMKSILSGQKQEPDEMAPPFLEPTGGKPPGSGTEG